MKTKIDTIPQWDRYHQDTNGVTTTVLIIDPERNMVYIEQEEDTGSCSMYRWHERELVFCTPSHPTEESATEFLEENRDTLEWIIEHRDKEWDGSNTVGCWIDCDEEDADSRIAKIKKEFESLEGYWSMVEFGDYFQWVTSSDIEVLGGIEAASEWYAMEMESAGIVSDAAEIAEYLKEREEDDR